LAKEYNKPVVIHSGSTFSYKGELKYSHPLNINQLATEFENINFIIAHLGDPWIMDSAAVIDNSNNVYADLSGLIVGDQQKIEERKDQKLFVDRLKQGLIYNDCYDKLLFGSDWPLVALKPYIKFIKNIIPTKHHAKVFYKNAQDVFNLFEKDNDY
jgi:predicted TIM-barrel fold metal-dependent hydrolase